MYLETVCVYMFWREGCDWYASSVLLSQIASDWDVVAVIQRYSTSGSLLGQSPVAQSFMQSFSSSGQGPSSSSSSYPYCTPLGPLSPYSGTTSSVSDFSSSHCSFWGTAFLLPPLPHVLHTSFLSSCVPFLPPVSSASFYMLFVPSSIPIPDFFYSSSFTYFLHSFPCRPLVPSSMSRWLVLGLDLVLPLLSLAPPLRPSSIPHSLLVISNNSSSNRCTILWAQALAEFQHHPLSNHLW